MIMRTPIVEWLTFLNDFKHYDVYVIFDDNSQDYRKLLDEQYSRVNFVQIDDMHCLKKGFINLNYLMQKKVTGWEKAVYYFAKKNKRYQHVWLIEDDVFIASENTIKQTDLRHSDADSLCVAYTKKSNCKDWYHWQKVDIAFTGPHYKSMVCATRLSKKMFACITQYAKTNKTLFFLEVFFPTLAKKNNLKCESPKSLSTIVWRHNWVAEDLSNKNFYHPVKEHALHPDLRSRLLVEE